MTEKSKIFKKCDHVTWKKMGDDRVILLDLNSGKYFSLNETATIIWKLIVSNNTLGDIMNEITKRFESDTVSTERDIQEIVGNFVANGLVSEHSGASSEPEVMDIKLPDFSPRPYIKPGVQEHAPIKSVTAGSTRIGTGTGHYWYPC